ncbi:uncharacterized protein LOC117645185 [Thrips palmi]|uniref:Uncharacterized protein LOC117645185 n=1 Tax=Thrips palmi TaxID=161013 RepID=A0A6P8YUA3_THRPL|nr:uncharacterized protein LOC117645185 [Thrips palmi]
MARHKLVCSKRSRTTASPHKFLCHMCSKPFKRSDHLKAHLKKCSSPSKKEHRPRSKCHYPDCGKTFFHKTSLLEHLRDVHPNKDHQDPISKSFSSLDDFVTWKEKEEEKTYSYFSMHTGESRKGGHVYFYCQHDGLAKPDLKKTSGKRGCGKVKKGNLCIAFMKVHKTENDIKVEYYPCHSHPLDPQDFQHQPLSRSAYQLIDQQLAWEVSPSKIQDLLRNGAFSRENREDSGVEKKNNYVSIKLIRERKRKVRNSKRLHKEDPVSVRKLFEGLRQEKYNPVILYKPLGMKCMQGPSEVNDLPDADNIFMFGIQTKEQAELFKQGCSKAMLVDDTHGTTQYDLKLLTVMVPDQNNRCWPVAHLITSHMDKNTLQYFFKAMKEKNPDADINVVVTDDDPALINAAELGFGKTLRHILCVWHLHQTFQRNIHSHGVPRNLDSELYSDLKAVINCRDPVKEFPALSEAFVKKFEASAPDFITYFVTYYMSRPEKWAMSYRNFYYANQNTTGANESFHHRLKKRHMKRRPNKRVDDLINILMKVEEDDFSTRKRENLFGVSAGSYEAVLLRHKKGMDMGDDCIGETLSNLVYEVMSSKDKSQQKYFIAINNLKCTEKICRNKCKEPECKGLCSHMLTCSCPDKSPVCKHIHKLYSFLLKKDIIHNDDVVDDTPDDGNVQLFSLYDNEQEPDEGRSNENALKKLKENVAKLNSMLDSETLLNSHLVVHANAVIDQLLKKMESAANIPTDIVMMQMKPTIHFSSRAKLQTQESQMLPFRRAKKRKKPANAFNQKLSPNAKERVKKNLLSLLSDYSDSEPDIEETIGTQTDNHDEPAVSSFTPSLGYVKKLNDIILKIGDSELSIIDLKSLEMQLSSLEEKKIQSASPGFVTGQILPSTGCIFVHSIRDFGCLCLYLK